jgi:hypothetical protein
MERVERTVQRTDRRTLLIPRPSWIFVVEQAQKSAGITTMLIVEAHEPELQEIEVLPLVKLLVRWPLEEAASGEKQQQQ